MMTARKDDSSFLQPILSVLGLIISSFSAIAPLFAQAQLSKFFIDDRLSLPASIVSVVFGILLSWYLISINGYISISIGIKKERGAGYPQPWKEINNKNVIPIVLIVSTFLFFTFFAISQRTDFIWAAAQVVIYVIFFTLIIGTFSLLIAQTKNRFQWEQQIANTGSLVYETLERNGAVNSGIRIIQNTQAIDTQELIDLNIDPRENFLTRRLTVETISQKSEQMVVFMSPDYQQLIATKPMDNYKGNKAKENENN